LGINSGQKDARTSRPWWQLATRIIVLSGSVWVATAVCGCTPTRSLLRPPYDILGAEFSETELQDLAMNRCANAGPAGATLPPSRFTTDGCSLLPNGSWTECCVEHDMAYWCGGSKAMRRSADRSLQACVSSAGHPALSRLIYFGVRVGGSALAPAPWRWGYGHPWLQRSFRPKHAQPDASADGGVLPVVARSTCTAPPDTLR
jgi:hypothetical protein